MRNVRTLTIALVGSIGLSLLATGCAAERHRDIPGNAKMVAQGQKELTYRAPSDGTIYVYDKSSGKLLYSGKLDRDEMLQIDAMKDRITVDGRTVMDEQIRDHDDINVFFERSPLRDAAVEARSTGRDTTIIREREVVREPRSSRSDSTITVRPNRDRVTVEGDSDVTIEQPESDSKVTIERDSDR